eukprot:SAG11_NODE_32893_length_280_cov_0.574586_1_plen_47_part_10
MRTHTSRAVRPPSPQRLSGRTRPSCAELWGRYGGRVGVHYAFVNNYS